MSVQSAYGQGIARRIRATIGLRPQLREDNVRRAAFGRGVYVVGMHRSGTWAAARAVSLLGVPLGDPDQTIDADWDGTALSAFNDRLLVQLGGTWSAPPNLSLGWEREHRVNLLADEARQTFATVFSDPRWAWIDPRLCLTLPFWRSVLPAQTGAILIVRHPLEVARSLESRNRLPLVYGLALWELYNRQAMRGLAGLPVFVTTYDTLVRDPAVWFAAVARFIASIGIQVAQPAVQALDNFIDHHVPRGATSADALHREPVAAAQRNLYETVLGLAGKHASFRAPALVSAA